MKQHEPILNYPRRSLAYTEKYINKIQNRLRLCFGNCFSLIRNRAFIF